MCIRFFTFNFNFKNYNWLIFSTFKIRLDRIVEYKILRKKCTHSLLINTMALHLFYDQRCEELDHLVLSLTYSRVSLKIVIPFEI